MDIFGREHRLSAGELQRQGEAAQQARAEQERLHHIELAARRFVLAVPYYHELTDHVEYEIAYAELARLLGVTPERLSG